MSDITERLDKLKAFIGSDSFLNGTGLSNEVNIQMFCYDPEDEIVVQNFTERLMADKSLPCNLIEKNLFKVFLSICDDMGITDQIPDMEKDAGKNYLLEQLNQFATNKDFVSKMDYQPHQKNDVILVTGVGDVFPFMRVHALLDAMQPVFFDVPILVMYPGVFTGYNVSLFNKLKPNDMYRAFNTPID